MGNKIETLKTAYNSESELNRYFIRYLKYLNSTTSDIFCEHFGILEYCARDRAEYNWEDRVIENMKKVEIRYPDLYIKMLDNLSVWLKMVANHKKEPEAEESNVIRLKS